MRHKDLFVAVFFAALFSIFFSGHAFANPDQAKLYKKVFGGDKPKCIACHVDKLPKKADGKHDVNDYGKKLIAMKAAPDEAAYRAAGPVPEKTA